MKLRGRGARRVAFGEAALNPNFGLALPYAWGQRTPASSRQACHSSGLRLLAPTLCRTASSARGLSNQLIGVHLWRAKSPEAACREYRSNPRSSFWFHPSGAPPLSHPRLRRYNGPRCRDAAQGQLPASHRPRSSLRVNSGGSAWAGFGQSKYPTIGDPILRAACISLCSQCTVSAFAIASPSS